MELESMQLQFYLNKLYNLKIELKDILNCRPKTPIDGGWSQWTSWSSCQSNCRQQRNRTCDSPSPLFGGVECPGNRTELSLTPCYGDDCCPGNKFVK